MDSVPEVLMSSCTELLCLDVSLETFLLFLHTNMYRLVYTLLIRFMCSSIDPE